MSSHIVFLFCSSQFKQLLSKGILSPMIDGKTKCCLTVLLFVSPISSHDSLLSLFFFFSSTGFLNRVKMEGTAAGHMSKTQACASAARTQAQIHTHAAMYELQWEEVSEKGEAKMGQGTVPSPNAVMCSTLPFPPTRTASVCPPLPPSQKWVCASRGCAISHPLHSLTWSGGMCGGGGLSAVVHCVVGYNTECDSSNGSLK